MKSISATYGHGTENDFLLIFDEENLVDLSPEEISRVCNRKTGLGADGLIRITKSQGKWFMDYRNADGSLAEMCGNGIRVMARYLVDRGHQTAGIFAINTRAGMKYLASPEVGDISVNLGQVSLIDEDIEVIVKEGRWKGMNIEIGNPHAVVFLESLDEMGDLESPPLVLPEDSYPDGVNVEFVEFLDNGELKMRVFERGVGETRSCGTGTCAVALAATVKSGKRLPIRWIIHSPGGSLTVDIDAHSNATLTGPAVLLSEHDLSEFLG
jgi:diaminopimelate epimerase